MTELTPEIERLLEAAMAWEDAERRYADSNQVALTEQKALDAVRAYRASITPKVCEPRDSATPGWFWVERPMTTMNPWPIFWCVDRRVWQGTFGEISAEQAASYDWTVLSPCVYPEPIPQPSDDELKKLWIETPTTGNYSSWSVTIMRATLAKYGSASVQLPPDEEIVQRWKQYRRDQQEAAEKAYRKDSTMVGTKSVTEALPDFIRDLVSGR